MNFIQKIKAAIKAHKLITIFLIVALVIVGYFGYQKINVKGVQYRYITAAAEKTTITVAIAGSGQIAELNSIDLKPSTSGALTAMNIKKGDQVKAGQVLAIVDQRSALSSLSQARASLSNAQANYDTLKTGALPEDIRISQNSVTNAENSYHNAVTSEQNTIKTTATNIAQAQKTYDDLIDYTGAANPTNQRGVTLTTISDKLAVNRTALDTENRIFTDENFKTVFGALNSSMVSSAKDKYNSALISLNTANSSLEAAKAYRSDANIDKAVNDVVTALNQAQASLNDCYLALQNTVSGSDVSQSQIDSYKSSVSSQLTSINTSITAVQNSSQTLKDAVVAAKNALDSVKLSSDQQLSSAKASIDSTYNSWQTAKDQLAKVIAPATKQELDSSLASLSSARTQLQQAVDTYNNTTIVAPFDGQIAVATPQKGDQVSASTVIATLITNQYVANVSLNEVDVAKIKLGNSVVLTFDALEELSLTGKVIDIDTLGTVSQGVVTYNVKISLDDQDPAIKPGMSTSVSIITKVKTDVIAVPNAAVKSSGGSSYVQTLDSAGKPQKISVQVGIADDSYTEIISGVNEGDLVVTQTIASTATAAKTTTTNTRTGASSFGGILGGGGPGGH